MKGLSHVHSTLPDEDAAEAGEPPATQSAEGGTDGLAVRRAAEADLEQEVPPHSEPPRAPHDWRLTWLWIGIAFFGLYLIYYSLPEDVWRKRAGLLAMTAAGGVVLVRLCQLAFEEGRLAERHEGDA